MTNQEIGQVSQALLIYESFYKPLTDSSLQEFEQVLSLTIPVKSESRMVLHEIQPIPWLEIILAFSSTTIATSMLTKIGEDVYSQLKGRIGRIIRERFGKKEPPDVTISIHTNEVEVEGMVKLIEDETLIDAMKTAQQMLIDAHDKQKIGFQYNEHEIIRSRPRNNTFRNKVAMGFSVDGLWYVYEYDAANQKWEYKGTEMRHADRARLDPSLFNRESSQPSQGSSSRICTSCGYKMERAQAKFCPHCGRSLAI